VKTATAVNRVKMLETLHDRVRFENSSVRHYSEPYCRPRCCFSSQRSFFARRGILPETVFGVEFGWVEFLLATPVQVVLGWPFYKNSYNALVNNRRANMDVLIALVRPLRISTQSRYLPD